MEIRDVTADDLDAVLDLRKRSFGPLSAGDVATFRKMVHPTLAAGRYLGAFEGGRLAAAARLRPFTQWWHGRPQPMSGVAGVTVSPEDRGRGVGSLIMRAVIERAAVLGDAVSALYPATTPLYRSLGYEHAGAQHRVTLPAESLRTIRPAGNVRLRRMGPDDAAEVIALLHRLYAASRASGPISWGEGIWRLWLAEEDDFLYLADDGFAVYRWDGQDIEVDNVVAGSVETAGALWSLVGTSSSVAKRVKAVVAPDDPVLWLLRERSKETAEQVRWMFRVIDLVEAVARRGWPAALNAAAVVRVEDPLRAGNAGLWRLEFAGGSGAATRETGEAGAPVLSANGFSALYAGVPVATLRRAGLMTGDERHDEVLDAAFAARPYMLDYF
ncbi:GNAT family N-acetyltransferase [Nonomuraea sp. MCN248]|uniref:GNAT family N-acetyltransferase n=1 Tax=Nonomuraea corallina TaxID=2989783 RepID=A0ABT4SEU7_9ACTN|nr:GNAT family N-acetyltransferase [Nonomuraea corallina]MDA0635722.1 GNAT family N-acetyltransferase [Nonomuraea corallina]